MAGPSDARHVSAFTELSGGTLSGALWLPFEVFGRGLWDYFMPFESKTSIFGQMALGPVILIAFLWLTVRVLRRRGSPSDRTDVSSLPFA